MKFSKIALIGALLVSSAPLAFADQLFGDLSIGGTGKITATSITFSHPKTTPPNKGTSPGFVLDSSVDFAAFTPGQPFRIIAGAPTANAAEVFATTTAAAPVHLFSIIESGETLDVYLTNISSVTVGTAAATGSFTGSGYVTLTGHSGKTDIIFVLTNSSPGAGEKAFSAELTATAPEPNSLALLGTGVMGVAGMVLRKRRTL